MREIGHRQRGTILVASVLLAVVQFVGLLYVLHVNLETGRTLIIAVGMLAIISGWPMAAIWAIGPAPAAARWRGVMRGVTGILGGVALLCGTGGSTRWMWASVGGASLTAVLSFFPMVGQKGTSSEQP